jgi:hypothetical protein
LSQPAAKETGRLVRFDQREFGDAYAISMADEGYVYVPPACETGRCRVHVAFHGCRQGAEAVGERFVREAGYNRWADANHLIVLYPQAIARYWWIYNPRGCWDWWGYTGAKYATKEGAQIRAVPCHIEPRRYVEGTPQQSQGSGSTSSGGQSTWSISCTLPACRTRRRPHRCRSTACERCSSSGTGCRCSPTAARSCACRPPNRRGGDRAEWAPE